jgi:hypothetical protein
MSAVPYSIAIRLTGNAITPERVSAHDAAILIDAVETLIVSVLPSDVLSSDVLVSLSGVGADGFSLLFSAPAAPGAVAEAFGQVAAILHSGRLEGLPPRAVEALRAALRVTHKHGAGLELIERAGVRDRQRAALIDAALLPSRDVPCVRGTVTLYGAVIRVGGEDPPRARLRLLNGAVMTCDLARRKGWALARDLGARLYQLVGVRGEALTRVSDRALIGFRIDRVLPYAPNAVERALDSIAAQSPRVFSQSQTLPVDLREE